MAASGTADSHLPAISLPSSLKAARVSLSTPSDVPSQQQVAQSGSQSAVHDLYSPPGARRASIGQRESSANANSNGGATDSRLSGNSSIVPGILPNSAFLTPRKPAGVAARQKQQQTLLRPGASVSLATNNGVSFSNPSSASMHGSSSSSSNNTSFQPIDARGVSMFPIDEDRPSHSSGTRSGGSSDLGDGSQSNGGTLGRNNSMGGHIRAESRQETIRSKASREPLIEGGLPRRSLSSAQNRSEHGKRKNSKTGSISSLLGFGKNSDASGSAARVNEHVQEKQRRRPSRSAGSLSMPPLHEVKTGEKAPMQNGQAFAPEPTYQGEASWTNNRNVQTGHPTHRIITVPVLSEKTHKPLRNYQIYREQQASSKPPVTKQSFFDRICSRRPPGHADGKIEPLAFGYGTDNLGGNNRFLLSGRLVTSGDSPYPFLGALAVALFMPGIFLAFEAEWLWHANAPASGSGGIGTSAGKALIVLFAYTTLIMWTSMLRTSLRDPGIIPKGLDREPDFESFAVPVGGDDDLTGTGMGQRPRLRHVRVREELVGSKWCETCQTYRPPRTSHCRLCDVCTEQTDHHCSFLNNCIGRRNYPSFVAFLLSACMAAFFVIGTSIAHLVLRGTQVGGTEFWTSWRTIGTLIVLVVTTAAALPLVGLAGYHAYLIWQGRTTIETVRDA